MKLGIYDIGRTFTKEDFEIKFTLPSIHRIDGEYYGFFNLGDEFENEITTNGFSFEVRHIENWDANTPSQQRKHIFVRVGNMGPFTYIGISECQVFFKDTGKVLCVLPIGIIPKKVLEKINNDLKNHEK